jgi:hypothetical protein
MNLNNMIFRLQGGGPLKSGSGQKGGYAPVTTFGSVLRAVESDDLSFANGTGTSRRNSAAANGFQLGDAVDCVVRGYHCDNQPVQRSPIRIRY